MIVIFIDATRRQLGVADREALIQPSLKDISPFVARVELLSEALFGHPAGEQIEEHPCREFDGEPAGAVNGSYRHPEILSCPER